VLRLEHIQPGNPQQNTYIERYNRTVRPSHRNCVSTAGQWDEWLSQNIFDTIDEAQNQATQWLWTYNNERPNNGHWRHNSRNETENSCVNSTAEPH
jgi:putative transposase